MTVGALRPADPRYTCGRRPMQTHAGRGIQLDARLEKGMLVGSRRRGCRDRRSAAASIPRFLHLVASRIGPWPKREACFS